MYSGSAVVLPKMKLGVVVFYIGMKRMSEFLEVVPQSVYSSLFYARGFSHMLLVSAESPR